MYSNVLLLRERRKNTFESRPSDKQKDLQYVDNASIKKTKKDKKKIIQILSQLHGERVGKQLW